ncbi:MAG: hypothetical protein RIR70_548 [Pseudomonadota bacterium]
MDGQLDAFMALLARGPGPEFEGVFNPWAAQDEAHDIGPQAPLIRRDQLMRYLRARFFRARIALIAEAPSYAGAKFCGIAMCCERMMLSEGAVQDSAFFEGPKSRTSLVTPGLSNQDGVLERTASIVWKTMSHAGFHPYEFVNWNAFAWHPHEIGKPLTNRTPTRAELEAGLPVLRAFLALFPKVKVVAVGQVCQRTLSSLGIAAYPVRHPSYGGAPEFRDGMMAL